MNTQTKSVNDKNVHGFKHARGSASEIYEKTFTGKRTWDTQRDTPECPRRRVTFYRSILRSCRGYTLASTSFPSALLIPLQADEAQLILMHNKSLLVPLNKKQHEHNSLLSKQFLGRFSGLCAWFSMNSVSVMCLERDFKRSVDVRHLTWYVCSFEQRSVTVLLTLTNQLQRVIKWSMQWVVKSKVRQYENFNVFPLPKLIS